jgi:hypothetical protein
MKTHGNAQPSQEPAEYATVSDPPPRYLRQWIAAFELAANEAARGGKYGLTHPVGLSRCGVCGAVLASPLAMEGHLAGKRHTRAVARRYYICSRRAGQEPQPPIGTVVRGGGKSAGRVEGRACPQLQKGEADDDDEELRVTDAAAEEEEEERGRLFDAHSSEPLRTAGWSEAPDVALALLHAALGAAGAL